MTTAKRLCLIFCAVAALCTMHSNAQSSSKKPSVASATPLTPHDGQHDFDFEFGTWNTHVSMLAHPLTGSKTWVEFTGMTVDHKIWNGLANLVELDMKSASSHLMLASLRLYNPATHQWGLYVVNSRSGTLGTPTLGSFANGRGVFYDKETWDGKPIVVRFVITPRSADAIHFEQAFSADAGKTWETNWVADDTRIAP